MDDEPVQVRLNYGGVPDLSPRDLDPDPLVQLQQWLDVAAGTDQLVEPSAMSLATVDREGRPAVRTVLLRRIVDGRLLFFTNYASRKADHIGANPWVALLFRWSNPQRQVEVQGPATLATTEESDEYFLSRPRGSQIGAHVSPQSRPLPDRAALDRRVHQMTARFEGVRHIPRPDDWGGYAVMPVSFEFWQGRASRLHDRFRYTHDGKAWTIQRLAP